MSSVLGVPQILPNAAPVLGTSTSVFSYELTIQSHAPILSYPSRSGFPPPSVGEGQGEGGPGSFRTPGSVASLDDLRLRSLEACNPSYRNWDFLPCADAALTANRH